MMGFVYFLCVLVFMLLISPRGLASEKISFVGADGIEKGFDYLDRLKKTGIYFYGIEQLRWSFIEPVPPQKGIHRYNWSRLDEAIRKIERVDGNVLVTVVCSSKWATKQKAGDRVASPPADDHWDDYKAFVQALVERYDKDGNMDMPGLKYAHLYYQIEDEAENLSSWNGTVEEYLKLLKTARESTRLANPNVKILTFSPNLGDFFDHLTQQEIQDSLKILNRTDKTISHKKARKLDFIKSVLGTQNAYDIIAIQYNYHYTGLLGIVSLIRNFSSKPIWVADAASATLLGRHLRIKEEYNKDKYPYLSEKEIASIISNTNHPKYKEISDWWEAEKARTTFKKIITAASLGTDHIFMQFILDMTSKPLEIDEAGVNPWNFTGLLGKNVELRPVACTIKLFHEKFNGFSQVEDLSKRVGISSEWILHYRFTVGERIIDVLWTDASNKKYILNVNERLSITRIIEKKNGCVPYTKFSGNDNLVIGRTPIIVERIKK